MGDRVHTVFEADTRIYVGGPVKIVYLAVAALVLAMSVWNLWREKDWKKQIAAAMVALPLLMRVLLIK